MPAALTRTLTVMAAAIAAPHQDQDWVQSRWIKNGHVEVMVGQEGL